MNSVSSTPPLLIPHMDPERLKTKNIRSPWAQLDCYCHIQSDEGVKTWVYAAVVNCKTKKLYRDDTLILLAAKLSMLAIGTLFALSAKTLYHLFFPLPLTQKIFYEIKNRNSRPKKDLGKKILKEIGKNCADIIRTPLYALAMSILSIATTILAIYKKEYLYVGRALYGELQQSLNWGKKKGLWSFAPCMQPIANLNEDVSEKKRFYIMYDNVYEGPVGSILHGLNNVAYKYTMLNIAPDPET